MGRWGQQPVSSTMLVRDWPRTSDVTAGLDHASSFTGISPWRKIAAIGIATLLFLGLTLWMAVWLTIRLL
jgi:hypothetical protein